MCFIGERYDFVLNANAEVGIYWIQVKSVQNCFKNDVYQMAILKYETSMDKTPRLPNSIFETFQLDNTVSIVLRSIAIDFRIIYVY